MAEMSGNLPGFLKRGQQTGLVERPENIRLRGDGGKHRSVASAGRCSRREPAVTVPEGIATMQTSGIL